MTGMARPTLPWTIGAACDRCCGRSFPARVRCAAHEDQDHADRRRAALRSRGFPRIRTGQDESRRAVQSAERHHGARRHRRGERRVRLAQRELRIHPRPGAQQRRRLQVRSALWIREHHHQPVRHRVPCSPPVHDPPARPPQRARPRGPGDQDLHDHPRHLRLPVADRIDGGLRRVARAQHCVRVRAADDARGNSLAGADDPRADVRTRVRIPRGPAADRRVQHAVRPHVQHPGWRGRVRLRHPDAAGLPALTMLGLLLALLAAAPAERWSLYGGETLAAGQDAFDGEVGWPATSLGWTHGLTDTTDAGVRLDILYAFETTTDTHFGLGLRVPLRAIAVRTGRMSLLVRTDPGLKVYPGSGTPWGFSFPVGAAVGFDVNPDLRFALGVDVPMSLLFSPGQFVIGTEFGFGVDYFLDPRLIAGFNIRVGPVFSTEANGSRFGLVTQIGIAYRM